MDSLEFVGQQTREQEGGGGTRAKGQKGVDDGVQPLSSGGGNSSVETRPHNPKEKCTKKREDIGAVTRGVVFVTSGVTVGQEPGNSETKVSAEKMNNHTSTDINGSDLTGENGAIDVNPEEHGFHEAHNKKLSRGNLTQDGTIGNQNGSGSEKTVQQLSHGNITIVIDSDFETIFLGLGKTIQDDGPLANKGGDKEGVPDGTESTSPQESHEETETNKDHNVDISVFKRREEKLEDSFVFFFFFFFFFFFLLH